MRKPRVTLTIFLDPETRAAFKRMALERETTASALARDALAQWLRRQAAAAAADTVTP